MITEAHNQQASQNTRTRLLNPTLARTFASLGLQDSLELYAFPMVQLPRPAGGVGLGELAGHRGSSWERYRRITTPAFLCRQAAYRIDRCVLRLAVLEGEVGEVGEVGQGFTRGSPGVQGEDQNTKIRGHKEL